MQAPPAADRRPDALGQLRHLPDDLLCAILERLTPRDVACLSCVSSVLYILCNEEPLWMLLCLRDASGLLEYKGSWKDTTLHRLSPDKYSHSRSRRLQFDGFSSMFLYKRWYRCFTALDSFAMDEGGVTRVMDLSLSEFQQQYDGRLPVLISGLADNWPARNTWTADKLLQVYGETPFKLSQRGRKKVRMRLRDYISYINCQHDEDPLYIFDEEFGDVTPNLLKDYSVPLLFREDYFDTLDRDERPPFRWLIIGPARSGASWHVDPGLTSAWNTLLCGRKRWALYPPGKVPIGVTVHVNEDDGDVNIDSPSSLQWWLDFYPLLADEDKPIECTQLPGETIFVPSGWWHCVLNLEVSVAVTQNFVNASNFEFVCMDMSPGHIHKGVARAGLLAIESNSLEGMKELAFSSSQRHCSEVEHEQKRPRLCKLEGSTDADKRSCPSLTFSYDVNFLSIFLDEERDHYNSVWSPSNCIGQREIRKWLHRLWVKKPGSRNLIWKGACLALNAGKWSAGMAEICAQHGIPCPSFEEKLPVGTGSNPVYLTGEYVIKIYVEDGLESSIHSLATELEFYRLISDFKSPLQDHVPGILASGILSYDQGSYKTYTWDGKAVPDAFTKLEFTTEIESFNNLLPFGVWKKKLLEMKNADNLPLPNVSAKSNACPNIWPYVISRRCRGDIFAELRETLSMKEVSLLASFLGDQMRNLHSLPIPSLPDFTLLTNKCFPSSFSSADHAVIPLEWMLFLETLNKRRKYLSERLSQWGDPVPSILKNKMEEYVPHDLALFLTVAQDENSACQVLRSPAWIHSDVMDDNIHLNRETANKLSLGTTVDSCNGDDGIKWRPSHILDFSDLSIGDPLFDVIPIYLDVFRGNSNLLEQFLESYRLPLAMGKYQPGSAEGMDKFSRLSYRAMCYCILHADNVLGTIFSLWQGLKSAITWEEVEETVWGLLNKYQSS